MFVYSSGQLFSGDISAPTFPLGTFKAASTYSFFYDFEGTLTISDLNAAPTPEPSGVALLGTGTIRTLIAVRRRLLEQKHSEV